MLYTPSDGFDLFNTCINCCVIIVSLAVISSGVFFIYICGFDPQPPPFKEVGIGIGVISLIAGFLALGKYFYDRHKSKHRKYPKEI